MNYRNDPAADAPKGVPIESLFAKEYEDPRDSAYLNALKLNKGFDKAAKLAIEYGIERIMSILYTGSNVRVTRKNMPYLYECVEQACRILNVDTVPDVYVQDNPYLNASTTGAAHPIIVLNNCVLQKLTHEELMFIIGHEVGHIKSEHLQYNLIGDAVLRIGRNFMDTTLIGSLISTGLNYAFYEWERCAEFTADHAGLLVCQNLKAAITALAKLGGYPHEYYSSLNAAEFLEQAQSFTDFDNNMYNKAIKVCLTLEQSHPWTVLRAKELMLWVQSGEYSRILNRCSSWMKKEIDRLATAADKAVDRHERMQNDVDSAVRDYAGRRPDPYYTEYDDRQVFKSAWAKGQEGLNQIRMQMTESNIKRKIANAHQAQKDIEEARIREKTLRARYNTSVNYETIKKHTLSVIGDLPIMKPNQ
ncbi:MAG: M48 family metallopeptidase [Clostridia bacterium]|nr:M48 family metallopeptidase [Clostridia bacterium]